MKSFEEWLEGENDRVFKEMNVTARELLWYIDHRDIEPEEAYLFFMIGAFQVFSEMSYDQKVRFVENKVLIYKKEYYEQYRKLRVIKGGLIV